MVRWVEQGSAPDKRITKGRVILKTRRVSNAARDRVFNGGRVSLARLGRVVSFFILARQDVRHRWLIHLVHQLLDFIRAHRRADHHAKLQNGAHYDDT